jgi:hypothetical protein
VSDRIAQQTEELERLTNDRDALAKKTSLERSRMSVNSGGVVDHDVVSRVRVGDVHRAGSILHQWIGRVKSVYGVRSANQTGGEVDYK